MSPVKKETPPKTKSPKIITQRTKSPKVQRHIGTWAIEPIEKNCKKKLFNDNVRSTYTLCNIRNNIYK